MAKADERLAHAAPPGAPSSRLATVPNVLSGLRLLCVPLFAVLFLVGREGAAAAVFAVGALTDFLDGYIARRTGAITSLGQFLDPLADRLFILVFAAVLLARGALPWWLALTLIVRDVLVLSVFPLLERRGMQRIEVVFVGKTATALIFLGLTCLALAETTFVPRDAGRALGLTAGVVGAVLYWVAGVAYAREARRRLKAMTQEARS